MTLSHTAKYIARFCRKHQYAIGSGYHNGLFIVSKYSPDSNRRIWRVVHAKHTQSGNIVFNTLDRDSVTQVGAKVVLQRALAERGISIHTAPNVDLNGIPTYPYNLSYGAI